MTFLGNQLQFLTVPRMKKCFLLSYLFSCSNLCLLSLIFLWCPTVKWLVQSGCCQASPEAVSSPDWARLDPSACPHMASVLAFSQLGGLLMNLLQLLHVFPALGCPGRCWPSLHPGHTTGLGSVCVCKSSQVLSCRPAPRWAGTILCPCICASCSEATLDLSPWLI